MDTAASAAGGAVGIWAYPEVRDLAVYLAKTLIAWGVPASVVGFIIIRAAAASARKEEPDELALAESESSKMPPFLQLLSKGGKGAEPVEYLKVERLNDKLLSFDFSLRKVQDGRRVALAHRRRQDFSKAFGEELGATLTDEQIQKIIVIDKGYREAEDRQQARIDEATRELRSLVAKQALTAPAPTNGESDAAHTGGASGGGNMLAGIFAGRERKTYETALTQAISTRVRNEATYITAFSSLLQPEQRTILDSVLKSRGKGTGWTTGGGGAPLSLAPGMGEDGKPLADRKHVYVLSFPGDVTASQVETLRQEVTAVVRWANASRGDEVVLELNSGGGTVTGYGLAAAQLTRLKNAGLKLTICVEQVAASGGYMMACVGDRLCASPFAVIGSIGVISELPNVYQRLKREGIEFQTITAGKFKRTLTPFKEPTEEDRTKSKEDIEMVFNLFKTFVKAQRPKVLVHARVEGDRKGQGAEGGEWGRGKHSDGAQLPACRNSHLSLSLSLTHSLFLSLLCP